jgi:hypothetical protein
VQELNNRMQRIETLVERLAGGSGSFGGSVITPRRATVAFAASAVAAAAAAGSGSPGQDETSSGVSGPLSARGGGTVRFSLPPDSRE